MSRYRDVSHFYRGEIGISEIFDVSSVFPVFKLFQFLSDVGGAEGKLLLPFDSVDEFIVKTVSARKSLATRLIV